MKAAVGAVLSLALVSCASVVDPNSPYGAAASPRTAEEALALTPEHFQSTATVDDDELDVTATITTQGGMVHRQGLLGIVWNDNFLRAIIDKSSGRTTFQVYQYINYEGDWRFYETVNYETPDGPRRERLLTISRDVVTCAGSRYGGCTYSEHFAFEVDEALLRRIAEGYVPGEASGWRFKYGARQFSEDWQEVILPAEVAGFLRIVDQYRAGVSAKQP